MAGSVQVPAGVLSDSRDTETALSVRGRASMETWGLSRDVVGVEWEGCKGEFRSGTFWSDDGMMLTGIDGLDCDSAGTTEEVSKL